MSVTTDKAIQDMLETLEQRKASGQLMEEWEGMLTNDNLHPIIQQVAEDDQHFRTFVNGLYSIFGESVDQDHLRLFRQQPTPALRLNSMTYRGLPKGMAADVLLKFRE